MPDPDQVGAPAPAATRRQQTTATLTLMPVEAADAVPASALAPASAPASASATWADQPGLMLEASGEGIYGVDLQGLCNFINPAAARLLGYPPEAVLGRHMHTLVHHSCQDGAPYPLARSPVYHACQVGVPCRVDNEVMWRRDGSAFPAEYTASPIIVGERVLGAVVTFVDISARKRQDAALREARDELERRVRERTAELSLAVAQLRELQAHLAHVREDERSRMAREIQDELGGVLQTLKQDMGWLEKRLLGQPQLRGKCQHMRGQVDSACDKVGRIVADLRPAILDQEGLWATLRWQVQDFVERSGLVCVHSIDIPPGLAEPQGQQATAIFRIFQEMLSNVARHAQASEVQIRVRATHGDITLLVKDNGRGAPPSAFERSDAFGVMGMRERADHFGGWLQIDSQPGQGTQLILSMPRRQADHARPVVSAA